MFFLWLPFLELTHVALLFLLAISDLVWSFKQCLKICLFYKPFLPALLQEILAMLKPEVVSFLAACWILKCVISSNAADCTVYMCIRSSGIHVLFSSLMLFGQNIHLKINIGNLIMTKNIKWILQSGINLFWWARLKLNTYSCDWQWPGKKFQQFLLIKWIFIALWN